MEPDLFDRWVIEALDLIPDEFREKMENVEILVEDFPDPETLEDLELDSKWTLLGLYVGVPLSERSFFSAHVLPERICLYRRPIMQAAGCCRSVPTLIRDVLIHELGHHFGFSDEQLYSMTGQDQ